MNSQLRLEHFLERLLVFKNTLANITGKVDNAVTDCVAVINCERNLNYNDDEKKELFDCEEYLKEKLHNLEANLEMNFNHLYEEIAIMLSTHLAIDHLQAAEEQQQIQLRQQQLRQQQLRQQQMQQDIAFSSILDDGDDSDDDEVIIVAERTTSMARIDHLHAVQHQQQQQQQQQHHQQQHHQQQHHQQQQADEVIVIADDEMIVDRTTLVEGVSDIVIDDEIARYFIEDSWLGDDSVGEISPVKSPENSVCGMEIDELFESDMVILRQMLENIESSDNSADENISNFNSPGVDELSVNDIEILRRIIENNDNYCPVDDSAGENINSFLNDFNSSRDIEDDSPHRQLRYNNLW